MRNLRPREVKEFAQVTHPVSREVGVKTQMYSLGVHTPNHRTLCLFSEKMLTKRCCDAVGLTGKGFVNEQVRAMVWKHLL